MMEPMSRTPFVAADLIRSILPADIVSAADDCRRPTPDLLPDEEAYLGAVAAGRRRDFALGRACAHNALRLLGYEPSPIIPGPGREPGWPPGIVGSITHCPAFVAAAVARRAQVVTVGIDAEVHGPLPCGIVDSIALPEEHAWLDAMRGSKIHWARVLFSAKESVYKAWFPLTHRWLGFTEARIIISPDHGTFHAALIVPGPVLHGNRVTGFDGRFAVTDGVVVTAVWRSAE